MQPNDRRTAQNQPERDTLTTLLRSRSVQTVLLVAAGLQVIAVAGERGRAEQQAGAEVVKAEPVVAVSVPAQPKVAAPVPEVKVQDESQVLAAKYRKQGYKVSAKLARTIHEMALEAEIDPDVAFGLVRAESGFRTSATSPVGAIGLMQLMPATARWMQPGVTRKQLRDPDTNLRVGFKYLRYLMDKYDGNEKLALLAYNRGPGTVDKALKRGRNPDNGYADFVKGKKDHGHKLYTAK